MGAVLCAAFYITVYFTAEAPKSGSLEWIGMYEKPALTRQGLLHRLKWLDVLWCFLMGLLSLSLYTLACAMVDVSMLRTSLSSGWLFLCAAPGALMAMIAYLLGKLLSGRFLGGLMPVLFLGFSNLLNVLNLSGILLLACFVLVLVFLTGKGFWAWLCLVLSGILLALAAWMQPTCIFFALPWLGTVLFAEILRMKEEDALPWHLILALLAALLSVGVTVTAVHFPLAAPDLTAALKTPGNYALFWQKLIVAVSAKLFGSFVLSPILLLPSASLLLAGVVMAVGAVNRRQTFGVPMLLWMVFGLAISILYPTASSLFLSLAVLTWLFARVSARGYRGAAIVTGLIPTVISALIMILTIWRYVL